MCQSTALLLLLVVLAACGCHAFQAPDRVALHVSEAVTSRENKQPFFYRSLDEAESRPPLPFPPVEPPPPSVPFALNRPESSSQPSLLFPNRPPPVLQHTASHAIQAVGANPTIVASRDTPTSVDPAPVPAPATYPRMMSLVDTPSGAFQALVAKGQANAKASNLKTLVSSFLGGCYVGMGGMLSLTIAGSIPGISAANPGLAKFIYAALFPVNLLFVLQAGGQLFTGNTAIMAAALCEKKATIRNVLRSWSISWIGNFMACATFAVACKYAGVLDGPVATYAANILVAKTSIAFGPLVVNAMLCNWMVCLAIFLSMQAKDMTGKYLAIWLPISTFVSIGFEHSVANMFVLPAGLLCSTAGVSLRTVLLKNLLPVTLGNAISGALLVGVTFSFMFGRLGEGK